MFFVEKWMIFAIAAAILWGASYAASGLLLRSSITPLVFYFCYSWIGAITATFFFLVRGEKKHFLSQLRELPASHAGWFVFSLVSASLGAWMTYQAVGAKNATLASMIEISYPLFVVIFTWLFFQEFQLNAMTCLGAFFVIVGVMLILRYSP
jgi:drug/metabolite transporter (DMT)-like permease